MRKHPLGKLCKPELLSCFSPQGTVAGAGASQPTAAEGMGWSRGPPLGVKLLAEPGPTPRSRLFSQSVNTHRVPCAASRAGSRVTPVLLAGF